MRVPGLAHWQGPALSTVGGLMAFRGSSRSLVSREERLQVYLSV